MSKHRWTGTLEEAIALLLFRAGGWMTSDPASIALAFVCDTARDRALTATGPGSGPLGDVVYAELLTMLYRDPDRDSAKHIAGAKRRILEVAQVGAPQTDHRAAPAPTYSLPYFAAPPSGSPPGAAERECAPCEGSGARNADREPCGFCGGEGKVPA